MHTECSLLTQQTMANIQFSPLFCARGKCQIAAFSSSAITENNEHERCRFLLSPFLLCFDFSHFLAACCPPLIFRIVVLGAINCVLAILCCVRRIECVLTFWHVYIRVFFRPHSLARSLFIFIQNIVFRFCVRSLFCCAERERPSRGERSKQSERDKAGDAGVGREIEKNWSKC